VAGVRLLDGDVNDRMEGIALGWARDLVDIYSASWGPNDDGATVEGPDRLAQEALRRGVTEVRFPPLMPSYVPIFPEGLRREVEHIFDGWNGHFMVRDEKRRFVKLLND